MATRTTSVSIDLPLWEQLTAHPSFYNAFPGYAALLDGAIRSWLRDQGAAVPDRVDVPLHEHSRRARAARRATPTPRRVVATAEERAWAEGVLGQRKGGPR